MFRSNEGFADSGIAFSSLFQDKEHGSVPRTILAATYVVDWGWFLDVVAESCNPSRASVRSPYMPEITMVVNWLPESDQSEDPSPTAFGAGAQKQTFACLVPPTLLPLCGDAQVACAEEDVEAQPSKPPPTFDVNVKIVHPPNTDEGTALMHAKLFVIDFGVFVRFVVSSANLTQMDWVELGQNIWYVDAPVLPSPSTEKYSFHQDILEVLQALSVPPESIPPVLLSNQLNLSDTVTNGARLVMSVPSCFHSSKDNVLEKLHDLVAGAGVPCHAPLFYLASAVGGISPPVYKALVDALTATDAVKRLVVPVPSLATVSEQLQCTVGSITARCFQVPRSPVWGDGFVDFEESRAKAFHCKVLLCADPSSQDENEGWAFVGSHNLTADCWLSGRCRVEGKLLSDPRNFELGVFIPNAKKQVVPFLPPEVRDCWRRTCSAGVLLPWTSMPQSGPSAPFKFFDHKGMILEKGSSIVPRPSEEREAVSSVKGRKYRQRWYHWWKFVEEFSNNFGRH